MPSQRVVAMNWNTVGIQKSLHRENVVEKEHYVKGKIGRDNILPYLPVGHSMTVHTIIDYTNSPFRSLSRRLELRWRISLPPAFILLALQNQLRANNR